MLLFGFKAFFTISGFTVSQTKVSKIKGTLVKHRHVVVISNWKIVCDGSIDRKLRCLQFRSRQINPPARNVQASTLKFQQVTHDISRRRRRRHHNHQPLPSGLFSFLGEQLQSLPYRANLRENSRRCYHGYFPSHHQNRA